MAKRKPNPRRGSEAEGHWRDEDEQGEQRKEQRSDRAAPPDAAGGQGSFTRPEDVMETGDDEEQEEHPDLHWSPRTGNQRGRDA